jgi:hypothetical protein
VAAAQPFQTDSAITANGIVTKTAPAQTDRVGNTGAAGSVTVRVDKSKPSITAAQTKNADGTTTVTFTCSDSNSGGGEPSGVATCVADGSTTNSRPSSRRDRDRHSDRQAGNTATASSTAPPGTRPLLSSRVAPTTQPNGSGWYKGDVTSRLDRQRPGVGHPDPAGRHHDHR